MNLPTTAIHVAAGMESDRSVAKATALTTLAATAGKSAPPPPPPPPAVEDSVHISEQAQVRLDAQQGETPSEIAFSLGMQLSDVTSDLFLASATDLFYGNTAGVASFALAA